MSQPPATDALVEASTGDLLSQREIDALLAESRGRAAVQPKPPLPYRAAKRAFDVVGAAAGLAVLSPLLLGAAVAVRATSPGPIVIRQKRYGKDGRHFTCYKFRTMKQDTPPNVPTSVMRERKDVMTPVGPFLRRSSIDELPQLVNILKGEMSAVGPRPMILSEYEQVLARDAYGANDIRPGLTGWAQVNGRDAVDVERKAQLDGEYRRGMSPLFDAAVMLKSLKVVFTRAGYISHGAKGKGAEARR